MRVYVRVSIRIHVSDLALLFFSQFLPSGVRSTSYRSAISFKWTSSSLSLEGNLFPLFPFYFFYFSFSEICTSHESKERVRIIIQENRIIRDLRLTRDTRAAKSILDGIRISSAYRKSIRDTKKNGIPGSRLPRDAAKIFPYDPSIQFSRAFPRRLRRRCNRRTNAIQLKENAVRKFAV